MTPRMIQLAIPVVWTLFFLGFVLAITMHPLWILLCAPILMLVRW